MNTTAAAIEANVTVATIRTWCRRGVVTATKTAGRWIVDATSLAHRVTIGAMKRPAPKPVALTVETLTAIGGREWTRGNYHRVYFNNWAQFAGLEVTRYGTGNISSASLGGRGIANGRVSGILGAIHKVYFDTADGRLHAQHYGADEFGIRYLNGDRDHVDLVQRTFDGIRAAVAALDPATTTTGKDTTMPQQPATERQINRIMAIFRSIRAEYGDDYLEEFYSGATQRSELEKLSREEASDRIRSLEDLQEGPC